jgi:Transposase/DDE superfamily endonuclease
MGKHLTPYEIGKLQSFRTSYSPRTNNEIAQILKCDTSTCYRSYYRIKTQTGAHRKKGSGRKRIMTKRGIRHIISLINKDPYLSNNNIKDELSLPISQWTIGRRLCENGYYSYYTTSKPFINTENIRKRLVFAHDHKEWVFKQWKYVLWSDEKAFAFRYGQEQRIWRKKGQKFKQRYPKATIKHDREINIWACFSYFGKGLIHRIKDILDAKQYHNILQTYMIPSINKIQPAHRAVFQRGNDPKHWSNLCTKYWLQKNIKTLLWPSGSPDLNPMENAWKKLDGLCKDRKCKTENALFAAIQKAWEKMDNKYVRNLVRSMPRRMEQVIKAKGGHTKY